MLRTTLRAFLRQVVELFFRRVEVAGLDQVPRSGPTLFAINHPNALVDPLMVLCYAPRDVSFLAKEPLFRMPVIGWFARAFDAIPVYRKQDQHDTAKNRDTFDRARALLERGGTIAIAPEGTSHSAPALKPFKTGAARIALGAGTKDPVRIVPVGLFYTDKATFRSAVLVYFGRPIEVAPAPLGPDGEPPADRVAEVTDRLGAALAGLLVSADRHEVLELVERTERLLAASLGAPRRPLDQVRLTQQRLLAGYQALRTTDPARLARFVRTIDRLDAAYRLAGLDPAHPTPPKPGLDQVFRGVAWLVFRIGVFLPLALPGLVLHAPAYRVVAWLAPRAARDQDDVLATVKIIAAAIFYPMTWIAAGWAVGWRWGFGWGWVAGLAAPLAGYAALKLVERFDRFLSGARALGFSLAERDHLERLGRERDRLRADLEALAPALGIALPPR